MTMVLQPVVVSLQAGTTLQKPLTLILNFLRLVSYRTNGLLSDQGTFGLYWSSTVSGTNARLLSFNSTAASPPTAVVHTALLCVA